jgi:hypothetical protein
MPPFIAGLCEVGVFGACRSVKAVDSV